VCHAGRVVDQSGVLVCSAEPVGDRIVVTPSGELDAFVAPSLRALFDRTVCTGDYRVIVADLSNVSFLDSAALGALVGALRQAREQGSELRLVFPRGHARRILELTSLDRVLPDYGTREAALAT